MLLWEQMLRNISQSFSFIFIWFQTIPTSRLASLPPAFISDKPFAAQYGLALVLLPREDDDKVEAVRSFGQDALNRDLLLNVEYKWVENASSFIN